MTRSVLAAGALGGIVLLLFVFDGAAQQTTKPPRTAAPAKPAGEPRDERDADEKAIRATAAAFVKAFNTGDARGAAATFLPRSEYVNSDGEAFEGRDAIEKELAAFLKQYPKAKIEMVVDDIRFVGGKVAIEEGRTAVTLEPGQPAEVRRYIAVDVNPDGEWKSGSVREFEVEAPLTAHDRLQELAWLVGDWIDESDDGLAATSCRWSDDGNFLLQDFRLHIAGVPLAAGQQRIGWDPLTGQFKSWVFDSEGGYSEGLWSRSGDAWLIRAHGVRPDGTVAQATNSLTPRSNDTYVFESTHRSVGGEAVPNVRVVVARRPPAPAAASAKKPTGK